MTSTSNVHERETRLKAEAKLLENSESSAFLNPTTKRLVSHASHQLYDPSEECKEHSVAALCIYIAEDDSTNPMRNDWQVRAA